MRHPDTFPSQSHTQPDDGKDPEPSVSDLMQEIELLRERITVLEAERHRQNLILTVPVTHEQTDSTVQAHDAHITIQRQQGAIAIAICTPQSSPRKIRENATSGSNRDATPSPQVDCPVPPPPTPMPSISSQPIESTWPWGKMMTPREVQELLTPHPEIGVYYVVTKGRRPGVYLSWSDVHELIDGLRNPCHWKKTNKYAAQGQYTVAYNKGNCEYRFQ